MAMILSFFLFFIRLSYVIFFMLSALFLLGFRFVLIGMYRLVMLALKGVQTGWIRYIGPLFIINRVNITPRLDPKEVEKHR